MAVLMVDKTLEPIHYICYPHSYCRGRFLTVLLTKRAKCLFLEVPHSESLEMVPSDLFLPPSDN